jgi:hypothetical protein
MIPDLRVCRHVIRQHFSKNSKNLLELLVVFPLHCLDLFPQQRVIHKNPAEPDKRAHYRDINFNGLPASEDTGEHGDALFRKSEGAYIGVLERIEPITICDQLFSLFFCELKHEIRRESLDIPFDRLIQDSGFDSVKFS